MKKFSRRDFLKKSGLIATGGFIAASSPELLRAAIAPGGVRGPVPVKHQRSNWVYELVRQRPESDHLYVEYRVRDGIGGEVFLLNDHKMQIRSSHQRVQVGPMGGLLHISGAEVLPDELEAFMQTPDWHNWVSTPQDGSDWQDSRSRTLTPFDFPSAPWAGGRTEYLDPQWLRENYTLGLAGQIDQRIQAYLDRASVRGWVGDRRGTTLNLQVGASADDAFQLSSDTVSIVATSGNSDSVEEHLGNRFQNVTVPNGATIDSAILKVFIDTVVGDEPKHQIRGQAAANPGEFTTTSNDIDGRTRTTASVQWNSTNIGIAAGSFQEWGCTTDGGAGTSIAAIPQELKDTHAHQNGDAMVLIYEQHTSSDSTRDLQTSSYDNDTAQAATLDLDYTAAAEALIVIVD